MSGWLVSVLSVISCGMLSCRIFVTVLLVPLFMATASAQQFYDYDERGRLRESIYLDTDQINIDLDAEGNRLKLDVVPAPMSVPVEPDSTADSLVVVSMMGLFVMPVGQ